MDILEGGRGYKFISLSSSDKVIEVLPISDWVEAINNISQNFTATVDNA